MWRLALALLFLASCGVRDGNALASPSASTTVTATATASPTPTATPTPVATATANADAARYGYVASSNGRITVRAERTSDVILAIAGQQVVASHDGKRIAFWRSGPQGNNPQELRIAEIPGGTERVLTTIPVGQGGGAIAWANDDTGLLYEVHSTAQPVTPPATPRPVSGPDFTMLIAFDLLATQAPGSTTSDLMLRGGFVFIPLAWDKAGKFASALTTGEGGYAVHYYTWDMTVQDGSTNPVKRTMFPWSTIYASVRASHDAKQTLSIDWGSNSLHVWPIGDIGLARMVKASGTARITDAAWRPGSTADIAVVEESTVRLVGASASTIYRGTGPSNVGILAWRADGSGILLADSGSYVVVALPSGQATNLSGFTNFPLEPVLLR